MRLARSLFLVYVGLLATGCKAKGNTVEPPDSVPADTGEIVADADSDTIPDDVEGEGDPDADGVPNRADVDSDGDGIYDSIEAGDADLSTPPIDSDSDGTPDYLDTDSDGDGVDDRTEAGDDASNPADTDADGTPDYLDTDDDGDGFDTATENGDSEVLPDSDHDGIPNYLETDSDNDGMSDAMEGLADSDGDGLADYTDTDSDGDGISDADESGVFKPGDLPRDTDADGTPDYLDTDSDDDLLSDANETREGTDACDADTDGDGAGDGIEVAVGTDPLDASSYPEGMVVIEAPKGSKSAQSLKFPLSLVSADVVFLLDTTASMSSTVTALATEFSDIVVQLSKVVSDTSYGFATFDDYNFSSMGSGSDKPFYLGQQVTSDIDRVDEAMSGTRLHSGGDWSEAGMEGLYQTISGAGYDQDCDAEYDESDDVAPFVASATDPFGGAVAGGYDAEVPGSGIFGGVGFREGSMPIVVQATDAPLRDPDDGGSSPGGCAIDAGQDDVVAAFSALGARYVGISVSNDTPLGQMESLAEATGSLGDIDGDGKAAEPLAFTWTGSSDTFRETVIEAVTFLLESASYSVVSLVAQGDEWGFYTGSDPKSYTDVSPFTTASLAFDAFFVGAVAPTTENQTFNFDLVLVGDGRVTLGSIPVVVVVPGMF